VAFLALVASLLGSACHSAASVILDLPEPEPEQVEEDPAALALAQQAAVQQERAPLPIELTESPDTMLSMLPRAAAGDVDWVEAIQEGVIDPRRSPPGEEETDPGFGFDFYFGEMETFFPHSSHVAWVECTSCHPAIYRSRDIKTSMAEIGAGESCGECHGTVAFSVNVCERCHPAAALPAGRFTAQFENDIVFTRDTTTENAQEMTSLVPSIFPHWRHRIEFACSACHSELFAMEAGANVITMDAMQMGENCGTCHDSETAFGVMSCPRCHRDPPDAIVAPAVSEDLPDPASMVETQRAEKDDTSSVAASPPEDPSDVTPDETQIDPGGGAG
jgi:c(7)-type cytochrome triheme protein